MEWQNVLQAVLSLVLVLGLLFLTLWFVKYCELKGLKCRFMKKLKVSSRLDVVEVRRIDTKNSIVLFKCDDKEYLVLQGFNSNLLIDSKPCVLKSEEINE